MRRILILLAAFFLCLAGAAMSAGQGAAAEHVAKQLFGQKTKPAALKPEAIGFYSRGCQAGAVMLPATGPAWQAMRLSRNRNWAQPQMVDLVQRLAVESKELDGWPGLLIGDMAQPRGGPMVSGHRSHQIGLDADIWLMPMPDRVLTRKEREEISAISMIKSPFDINGKYWRPGHVKLLKRAAEYPEVARIFVHPAIKKALCEAAGPNAKWLHKIRPWWGHHYHFHVRIKCPRGSPNCKDQAPPAADSGCGKELDHWFAMFRKPKPPEKKEKKEAPKRKEIMIEDLPEQCRAVLAAADSTPQQYAANPPPVIRASAAPALRASARVQMPTAKPRGSGAGLPWLQGITTPPLPDRKPQ